MAVSRRILHVDDDPQLTAMVTKRLRHFGYEVAAMHDPCHVIQQLPQVEQRVMLLDIDMPRINGLDLLKEIKTFDGGILVVMLSGLVTMQTVLESLRLGAEACFFKPVTDIEPMADALAGCFRKLDRWWSTLDDLLSRRKVYTDAPNTMLAELTH